MVAGDVVNTAARLQRRGAGRTAILVGEGTYRATRQAIDYREAPPVEAKGKAEPVKVWEAVGARSRFGSDVDAASRGRRSSAASVSERCSPTPSTRARGASSPARHARRRAWDREEPARRRAVRRSSTRMRRSSPGGRVALSPTASVPASGRSARSSRPMPGFSSPTTLRRRRRSSSRWWRRWGGTSGSGMACPPHTPAPRSRGRRAGRSRRSVRGVAATTRGCGRTAAPHTRVRGHPLGRRRLARLRRPPRRLGDGVPHVDRRNRSTRAARPASRVGWRKAERAHAVDRRAVGRGDGPAPAARCSTGPSSPPRLAGRAARARGRQPAVRGGVRADADAEHGDGDLRYRRPCRV